MIKVALMLAFVLPLAAFPWVAVVGRLMRGRTVGWLAFAFPTISLASLAALAVSLDLPNRIVVQWPWVPSLGVNFAFLVDGLSLFFGLVVSGMGVLVFLYAIYYLDDQVRHQNRFYCYLILFMAAMLGTVFSDNLILLFVFWELTGIASFLLIGFLHHEEASRVGARQALLITSFTGLIMLVGMIMVGQATGTYSLAELLAQKMPPHEHGTWLTTGLMFMVVGAFGKSAQFPLHFWLPNAMSAPTPVSAYLHSATMVKLGVFLSARLFPVAVGTDWWEPMLGWVGFTTMWLAALLALLSHELKAILAFSTVSQLGFLIGYYGLGPVNGVEYDYLHIVNHVFYKGCLFMVAGIVMHATGRKDIRHIGGLFRRMPLLGIITLVAAATMAGLPGTTGFLSKEGMFKEIFGRMSDSGWLGLYAAISVVVMSLIKVAFSARLFADIFLGREPEDLRHHFHAPPLPMLLPPLLLALAALGFGVLPGMFDQPFQRLAAAGLNQPPAHIVLWHGFTVEFVVSVIVVLLGAGLYFVGQITRWRWHRIPAALRFDQLFELSLEQLSSGAKTLTRWLRSDQPLDFLPIVITFVLLLIGGPVWFYFRSWEAFPRLLEDFRWGNLDQLRSLVAVLISLAVVGVVFLKRWTTQLISLSVAGFLICFYFVLYRAPDLALTQILIEVVTLFMVLLLLGRFPRSAEVGERTQQFRRRRNIYNFPLAVCVGAMMAMLVAVFTTDRHPSRLGDFFLANTEPLAEGSNAVNTILVDFRGFDTLGEITVLIIAMLGCLGLLMRYKRSPEEYKAGPKGPPGFGIRDKDNP